MGRGEGGAEQLIPWVSVVGPPASTGFAPHPRVPSLKGGRERGRDTEAQREGAGRERDRAQAEQRETERQGQRERERETRQREAVQASSSSKKPSSARFKGPISQSIPEHSLGKPVTYQLPVAV